MADIYTLHYIKSVSSSILKILLSLISTLHYIKSVFFFYIKNTVKPVLRGHFRTKKKWSFKAGDLLKEV